ncbi:hypothetical protein BDZ88DRAFT_450571 [Geranomyces variabilis]|nr:hypothetical protein BDZ88DRAFT_450571 [Geranomyces variabilis]
MRFLAVIPFVTLAQLVSTAPTLRFLMETSRPATPARRPTSTSTPIASQSSAIVPATGHPPPFVTPIATTGFEQMPGRASSLTPTAIQSSAITPAPGRPPPSVTPIATTGFERTAEPMPTFLPGPGTASDSDGFGGPTTETDVIEPTMTRLTRLL